MDYSRVIISVLEHHGIEYWTSGKNVSADSINIQCPLCDDHSNHCGIFIDTMGYHCWICNRTGTLDYLIARITHRDIRECADEIASFGINFEGEDAIEQIRRILHPEVEGDEVDDNASVVLPPFFEAITNETQFTLLDRYCRGEYIPGEWRPPVSRQVLIEHGCGICTVGSCMNRLVVPVYFQGELVSYQAADLTGQSDVKYRTAKGEINQFLYRWDVIDSSFGYLVIVEGVRDAWRLGGNVVATFGTSLTTQQRKLISQLGDLIIVFCWDGDSWFHTKKEVEAIQPLVSRVGVVEMPLEHDPDSWGYDNTWKAINETLRSVLT